MADDTCSVEGCERPRRARGLCRHHYQRARNAPGFSPITEKPSHWHRISQADLLARTGICSICGPTRIRPPRGDRAAQCKTHEAALVKERRRLLRGSSSDAGTPRWPRRPSAGRRNLAHFYGLTLDEFDALVLAHEGRCALCGQAHPKLNVDHCHETGKVRGLLCIGCNTSLGRFGDNEAGLLRALAYIRS